MQWSDHELTPFGIDSSAGRAGDTGRFFPSQSDHFARLPVERLGEINSHGLLEQYDFIYWAVWDNYRFDRQDRIDLLKRALENVRDDGRLILGFYDREPKTIENKIARIKDLNLGHAVRVANPNGPQVLLRFSK